MTSRFLRPVLAVFLLTAVACSGGQEKASAPANANAQRVDAATAGTIVGKVAFEGEAPKNPAIKMTGDPLCARAHPDGMIFENYVVKDGGLDNVFVYVKDGLGNYQFEAPAEPVKLNQEGCRYVPHVLGARVGQPIEITNSDETAHNVHSLPDVNREFNFAQYVKNQKKAETFTAPEVMIRIKCDLHGWMSAYVGVLEHPYFAVTSSGGKFELKGLPPGEYTIETWHEKAGTRTQKVTVGAKETKEIGFTYGTDSAN